MMVADWIIQGKTSRRRSFRFVVSKVSSGDMAVIMRATGAQAPAHA